MADGKKVVTKKTAAKTGAPAPATKKAPAKKTVTRKTAGATRKTAVTKKTTPVTKKTLARKTVARKTTPEAAVPEAAPSVSQPLDQRPVRLEPAAEVTPEERWRMIAEAAYYRAERRNFAPGRAVEDWTAAEAEVDELLRRRGG